MIETQQELQGRRRRESAPPLDEIQPGRYDHTVLIPPSRRHRRPVPAPLAVAVGEKCEVPQRGTTSAWIALLAQHVHSDQLSGAFANFLFRVHTMRTAQTVPG